VTGSDQVSDCIDCVAGQYVDVTGSAACIDCAAGKYIDVARSDESTDCIECIAGGYIDVTGGDQASDCIGCVAGRYVDVTGSDQAADCIACAAGKYVGTTGSDELADCIDCAAGSFAVASDWFDGTTSPAWALGTGPTWTDAVNFCVDMNKELCPYSVYCPNGGGSPPFGGTKPGDKWSPMSDAPNRLVQVGLWGGSAANTCLGHHEIAG
jgi:hypothetical protein